ncbi:MAG: hypothetical protein JW995_05940 [Melioribacteraceae bacterium]|nr:hypothetical protein [Melioribacteraceae bacterium]
MKSHFLAAIIITLFLSSSCKENSNDSKPDKYDNNFRERNYLVFIPSGYDTISSCPLLFVFHGANGNASDIQSGTNIDKYADQFGIIVCYPDAVEGRWNDGCKCDETYEMGIDDLGFVEFLIDTLIDGYRIDDKKIFACGYSNGGHFTQNIGCNLSHRFAAIATVSATMPQRLYAECYPENSISVLMINGTYDDTVPWSGLNAGVASLVSAENAIRMWARYNGCATIPAESYWQNYTGKYAGILQQDYSNCSDSCQVILLGVEGGGHFWFSEPSFSASKVIIEFFIKSK